VFADDLRAWMNGLPEIEVKPAKQANKQFIRGETH
jgi:hypothetical protein